MQGERGGVVFFFLLGRGLLLGWRGKEKEKRRRGEKETSVQFDKKGKEKKRIFFSFVSLFYFSHLCLAREHVSRARATEAANEHVSEERTTKTRNDI